MMSTRRGAVTLAIVALLAMLGAIFALSESFTPASAGPVPADRYYSAYLVPTDQLDVADTTVDGGTYKISYAVDVHFSESTSSAMLVCRLQDPNRSLIRLSPDSVRRIPTSANVQHIEFSSVYELPPVSLGIRCHTTVSGVVKVHFSNITLATLLG
jgi:hypothetical protein